MSIGKQMQAFLEVSESFLLQSAVRTIADAWPSDGGTNEVRGAQTSRMSAVLAPRVTAKSGNGGEGHQGGGVMQPNRQHVVWARTVDESTAADNGVG